MANKLISQLTNAAANLQDTDRIEGQKNGTAVTLNYTGAQMRAVEKAERQNQDNIIEASAGLQADGSYVAPANSWFLRAADYAAGCTDRGGATGALSENILNGLRLLDARIYQLGNGGLVIAYLGLSADTTLTNVIPAGYMLEYIVIEEKTGGSPILDLGTTSGGNQVMLNQVLESSGLTTISIERTFSLVSNTTLYLNDDDASSTWDASTVDVYFVIRPITAGGAIASVSGTVNIGYYTFDSGGCDFPSNAVIEGIFGLASDYAAGTVFLLKDTDTDCSGSIYFITTDGTDWYINSATFEIAT